MDFEQAFLSALHTGVALTKTISLHSYLPISLSVTDELKENMPYLQAYGNIHTTYPYYYEISQLNSYCLLYTECGSGTLIIENNSYTLAPNTLALIDCRIRHRIEIRHCQWNFKVFFIDGTLMPFLFEKASEDQEYALPLMQESIIPNMIKKFYSQLSKRLDNSLSLSKLIIDLLLEVITEKCRQKENNPPVPDYLMKIKYEFDTNYQNSFTLDSLEQFYHISKYRICREFTQHFHMSPIQYLYFRRIEVVKETLTTTDIRINEIGRMVGFENTNLLIRLFKKNTGVTPLNYRKKSPVFLS